MLFDDPFTKFPPKKRKLLAQMSEWLFSAQDMTELQAVVTLAMERLFPETDGVLYIFSNSRDVLDWTSHWGMPQAAEHLRPGTMVAREGMVLSL